MKTRKARKAASRLSTDDRMADILAAARAVIAEKGYENTLLSDIAKRAGVVDGTIYRYFENKRDLLIQVAEAWFGEQLTEDSHLGSIHGTQNKLRHLAWRTLAIIKREPVLARFMLMELRPDPNYKSSPFFELNKRFTHEVLQVCREAAANGEFLADVTPNLLRDMLHGCIEHRTWAFLRGEGDVNIEEIADGIAKVIYRGMRAEHPATRSDIDTAIRRLDEVASRLEAKLG
jgi:AcrR family transcriptional regulator